MEETNRSLYIMQTSVEARHQQDGAGQFESIEWGVEPTRDMLKYVKIKTTTTTSHHHATPCAGRQHRYRPLYMRSSIMHQETDGRTDLLCQVHLRINGAHNTELDTFSHLVSSRTRRWKKKKISRWLSRRIWTSVKLREGRICWPDSFLFLNPRFLIPFAQNYVRFSFLSHSLFFTTQ